MIFKSTSRFEAKTAEVGKAVKEEAMVKAEARAMMAMEEAMVKAVKEAKTEVVLEEAMEEVEEAHLKPLHCS